LATNTTPLLPQRTPKPQTRVTICTTTMVFLLRGSAPKTRSVYRPASAPLASTGCNHRCSTASVKMASPVSSVLLSVDLLTRLTTQLMLREFRSSDSSLLKVKFHQSRSQRTSRATILRLSILGLLKRQGSRAATTPASQRFRWTTPSTGKRRAAHWSPAST